MQNAAREPLSMKRNSALRIVVSLYMLCAFINDNELE